MLANPFSLNNEYTLITGGGTGIGLGIAQCLYQQGAKIAISGRRQDVLEQAAKTMGPDVVTVVGDVTIAADREKMISEVEQQFGHHITILVNNAGFNQKKPAEEFSEEEFNTMLQTHVVASFELSKLVSHKMRANKHGKILMMASMTSFISMPKIVSYTTAKTAIVGLTRSLALEWAKENVQVNAVAPGFIYSEMSVKALDADPERKAKVMGRIMTGERGTAEDIGWAAAYLCSPAANYVTGTVLTVDGGYSVAY